MTFDAKHDKFFKNLTFPEKNDVNNKKWNIDQIEKCQKPMEVKFKEFTKGANF